MRLSLNFILNILNINYCRFGSWLGGLVTNLVYMQNALSHQAHVPTTTTTKTLTYTTTKI